MESQDSVPLQSDDVQRGSPENRSTRRLHTGQQLVNRMPSNPKIAVFESTQERFEVPLRPDLRSTYPVGGGPGSSFQQQPNPNVCQTSYVRRARNASDDRTGVGVRRRKKQRSSHHSSKENNSAPDNSRRLTDYFLAQDDAEAPPRPKACAKTSQILNIRCNPSDVIFTIQLLNPDQYEAVEALGFGPLLRMEIDAVESRELLAWLMDRVSPVDMIIRIGPGKVLPITPESISMVLGLPIGGSRLHSSPLTEVSQFRKQLITELNQELLTADDPIHISNLQEEILKGRVDSLFMSCFFMIVFNSFLFPKISSNIDSSDINKVMHPELFSAVDLSQAVFNDLHSAVRNWHGRDRNQLIHPIFGCAVFLIVLYLDNLQHTSSPTDWISTPRVRFYGKDTVHRLTVADRVHRRDGFKIRSSTCYDAVDVRNVGFDDMTDVPTFHLPRMRDLLSRPLGCLTGRPLQAFLGFFEQFDQTLSENTRAIQASLCNIAKAPYRLAENCGPVLEELIAAQSSSPDPNVIGETSRRNNSVIEEDIVDAHNVFEDGTSGVFKAPSPSFRDDVSRDGPGQNSSTRGIGQSHEQPVADPSSHFGIRPPTRKPQTESVPQDSAFMSRLNEAHFTSDEATLEADPSDTDIASATFYLTDQRTGKRMTRKPARYCSPFKAGIMSRPPPNADAAMSLLATPVR
ncbi:unnamed protein product [Urochloa decumbens]|uniref:Uncharacterized protein n=1 Tax=Urochloa decumbens TaxID=240449 RepID=A0ABC9BH69_9POAL